MFFTLAKWIKTGSREISAFGNTDSDPLLTAVSPREQALGADEGG